MSAYGLDDKFNKLPSNPPFRPLGNPLRVDDWSHLQWVSGSVPNIPVPKTSATSGSSARSPVVAARASRYRSALGISWRPVTRCHSCSPALVLVANPAPQPAPVASPPALSEPSDRYLKAKTLSWVSKKFSNQKNYIGYFIKALGDRLPTAYRKAHVVNFLDELLNSDKSPTTLGGWSSRYCLFRKKMGLVWEHPICC